MKKIILMVIFLVFCINLLAAQSGKWAGVTLTGEDELLLEGTIWQHTFGRESNYTLIYEFRAGGRMVVRANYNTIHGVVRGILSE